MAGKSIETLTEVTRGSTARPAVSIILPTYNRAKFLPQAFESIKAQQFQDWELIVVDDGSTDNSREIVAAMTCGWPQQVRYIYQENQGAYGARNTGLDLARGEYIAFYDSDDVWLPHHLRDCVEALTRNSDVDWVYGASQIVEVATGRELSPNSFYQNGQRRPFMKLQSEHRYGLRVIRDDRAVECMIEHGMYCGLQCSVIRRSVFENYRFDAASRNEAVDQLFVVESLVNGHRLAYFDAVHLVYRIHDQNSSAAGTPSLEKHCKLIQSLVDGYTRLADRIPLTSSQQKALDRRLGREYFWHLGYVLLQQPAHAQTGRAFMWRAICHWPTNIAFWKTYGIARLRAFWGAKC
jgi:glycosyltransferase involved in cell wall biosynthesis